MVVLMEARSSVTRLLVRPALIALVVSAGFALGAAAAIARTGDERRVIRIAAERFAFTPSEIEVLEGEEVELRISSNDTSHGFRIVGTNVKVAVPKRGKGDIAVVFKAEHAGRYEFECSRLCGAGHNFMRGTIRVRPREDTGAK
jgi:cytochrome c oxidase subunit 2